MQLSGGLVTMHGSAQEVVVGSWRRTSLGSMMQGVVRLGLFTLVVGPRGSWAGSKLPLLNRELGSRHRRPPFF